MLLDPREQVVLLELPEPQELPDQVEVPAQVELPVRVERVGPQVLRAQQGLLVHRGHRVLPE